MSGSVVIVLNRVNGVPSYCAIVTQPRTGTTRSAALRSAHVDAEIPGVR